MKDDDVLIRVENVSKRFCRDLKRSLFYGVQDVASEMLGIDRSGKGLRKAEFWANTGISFELRRGECLGLIGHNGAGKTTLLKMLNGLIKPDTGSITMRGQVGALIALGAGFNPILTGRENVYIAGSVLGLKKREIDAKYDEIVEFAELDGFMDSPVQNYSSGMQVRLGFAVATAMEPDILLIDEVLAVGDAAFRFKCSERISKALGSAAVIFVSHSAAQISQICSRGIVLESGGMVMSGEIQDCLDVYEKNQMAKSGSPGKEIVSREISEAKFEFPESCGSGDGMDFFVSLYFKEPTIKTIVLRVSFMLGGQSVAEIQTVLPVNDGVLERERVSVRSLDLGRGNYALDIHILSEDRCRHLLRRINCEHISVLGSDWGVAPYRIPTNYPST